MPFLISGSYNAKETALVNLNIRGNNIQIDQAFSVFPIDVLAVLETYNAKGVLEFDAAIIGELSNEKTPFFSTELQKRIPIALKRKKRSLTFPILKHFWQEKNVKEILRLLILMLPIS